MTPASIDPVVLAAELIRRPSVTPADAGAMDLLHDTLEGLGFVVTRLPFGGDDGDDRIENLYARWGTEGPNLCFAGHTDVVPPGDESAWTVPPFAGEERGGWLYGRGAVDMKSAIAAFIAAAAEAIAAPDAIAGSISLLITGDEEGASINGTTKVVDWLIDRGETIDACIVGEPTNPSMLGDMVKIGRRGSANAVLTVHGTQGHSAYPQRADNPVHRLVAMLQALTTTPLDQGTAHFEPSTLQVTSVDVGNPAANVIPGEAVARFNIRFNDAHDAAGVEKWIRRKCEAVGGRFDLSFASSGEPFVTEPGPFVDAVCAAIEEAVGRTPARSTSGGTSDARFIRKIAPVVEFGLVGQTMHQVDERTATADLRDLARIYQAVIASGPAA
ncbi:MAG: succinyl-diaminopimelate desuccinylase [Pseudomonadota bacterium]